ncbi:Trp family transcriptional regulator [Patescibacteria group bacterium]
MTQVSKYPIEKAAYTSIFNGFNKVIISLKDKKDTEAFLSDFLTPTEKIMLAKRLSIALLLERKLKYREISKVLRVSTTTVSNVALAYSHSKSYKKVIRKMLRDKKFEKQLTEFIKKVFGVLSAGKSKSGTWVYLRNEVKKRNRKL